METEHRSFTGKNGKARGQQMDEDSGSDMDDDEDGDEVTVVEGDDVDPKDRMD